MDTFARWIGKADGTLVKPSSSSVTPVLGGSVDGMPTIVGLWHKRSVVWLRIHRADDARMAMARAVLMSKAVLLKQCHRQLPPTGGSSTNGSHKGMGRSAAHDARAHDNDVQPTSGHL